MPETGNLGLPCLVPSAGFELGAKAAYLVPGVTFGMRGRPLVLSFLPDNLPRGEGFAGSYLIGMAGGQKPRNYESEKKIRKRFHIAGKIYVRKNSIYKGLLQ